MKSLFLIVTCLLGIFECSFERHHGGSYWPCPKPKPASNFNLNSVVGTWYNFLASNNIVPQGERCTVLTYSVLDNQTLSNSIKLLAGNSSEPINLLRNLTYSSSVPGVFKQNRNVTTYGRFGQQIQVLLPVEQTVLYLDSNYLLQYSCGSNRAAYFESFFLLKRNRNPENLADLWPILGLLRNVKGDLNRLVYVPNNSSCTL